MKRKMLFFEQLMYVDGITPINCVMTVRLRGTIHEQNLQTGLSKIQAKHALLRARIVEENSEPFFLFAEEPAQIPLRIIQRTGDQDWRDIVSSEWKTPFDAKTGPLLRLTWIRSEEVSELVITVHHCICDGSSVVTLLRELLQVTDRPETELSSYSPYATLSDLVPEAILSEPGTIKRIKKRAFVYKAFLSVFSRKNTVLPYGDPYVLYWNTTVEQFELFNHRCLAEKTSLHAAMCVAFLQAFQQIQRKRAKNKMMCPVSIRRFIRSVKSDTLFSFAPTIELSLATGQERNFWMLARQMKQSIEEKIEKLNIYDDLMLGDRMLPWAKRVVSFLRSSRGGHDVAFSNMGKIKIPAKHHHFQVEAVMGCTIVVPWRNTNTIIASSYLNSMELAFISKERFLPQKEAEKIQQCALRILQEAMAYSDLDATASHV